MEEVMCECGAEAAHEAILAKTDDLVLLCDLCFTRHAVRGLLKTGWLGKVISRPISEIARIVHSVKEES